MKRVLLATVLSLATVGVAKADVVFSDSTFNLGIYSATVPFSTDAIATLSRSQCVSCGVGASSGLQFVATFNNTVSASVGQTLINIGFIYDPSVSGPATSIDASIDKNIFTSLTGTGFTSSFRITLDQGGILYQDAIVGPTFNGPSNASTTGFVNIAGTGLLATNFNEFDPNSGATNVGLHPDFSTGTMVFGITQNSGTTGVGTITALYDNLRIDVHNGSAVSAPEPSSVLVLGAGMLGLLGLGFCRRTGAQEH